MEAFGRLGGSSSASPGPKVLVGRFPDASWAALWPILRRLRRLLAGSWPVWGRAAGILEAFEGFLETVGKVFEAILDSLEACEDLLGGRGGALEAILGVLKSFGGLLEAVWAVLEVSWSRSWASKRHLEASWGRLGSPWGLPEGSREGSANPFWQLLGDLLRGRLKRHVFAFLMLFAFCLLLVIFFGFSSGAPCFRMWWC